jgi:phosphate:Na+ symporter
MATNINALVRVVTELESVADTCGKLIVRARQHRGKKAALDRHLIEDILPYAATVERFLAFNSRHLRNKLTAEEYREAADMEERINATQKSLKKSAQKRIRRGGSVKAELFYIDTLRHIEHIGDFSLAISEALTRIR